MENEISQPESTPRQRLWHFLKKVVLWSVILYLLDLGLKYVGWDTWEKFSVSVDKAANNVMYKTFQVSPLVLYTEIRATRWVPVTSEKKKKPGFSKTSTVLQKTDTFKLLHGLVIDKIRRDSPGSLHSLDQYKLLDYKTEIPASPAYRKMTIWEKFKLWCRGFWYKPGSSSANWFGRVVLLLSLVFAWRLGWLRSHRSKEALSYTSGFFIGNIFLALLYLMVFAGIFYVFMKLLIMIGAAIVGLFSSIMALGAYMKYLVAEVKSEAMDHSKKASPALLSFFLKKK